ncbi:MAG: aminoglycoside phosphotransferase family protein [Eubacteriales bacterium]
MNNALSDGCAFGELNALFRSLGLGAASSVTPLSGGHLHRVFKISAESGEYAVKRLNPEVMSRPGAKENFIRSEDIASSASALMKASAALRFGGNALIERGGIYYLIYDFLNGENMGGCSVSEAECAAAGEYLARLHNSQLPSIAASEQGQPETVDFAVYERRASAHGCTELAAVLAENSGVTNECVRRYVSSASVECSRMVISHRDFDPKNVMRTSAGFAAIDWEAAGPIDAARELCGCAISWAQSGGGDGNIFDMAKYRAFIGGYLRCDKRMRGGELFCSDTGLRAALDSFCSLIEWLEYNVKRALGEISAGSDEMALGFEQTVWSVGQLAGYLERADSLYDEVKRTEAGLLR